MIKLDSIAIKAAYSTDFQTKLTGEWKQWRSNYIDFVTHLQTADRQNWLQPEFQEKLWDKNVIANIGPGRSVTVQGAYPDQLLAGRLFDFMRQPLGESAEDRGKALQSTFETILSEVQKYNKRRPLARVVRLLAALFPNDMCCLVDERRLWQVLQVMGVPARKEGFVAHHPLLREQLRAALGSSDSIETQIDQSIFTWFLWEQYAENAEPGAIPVTPKGTVATDRPALSLLPANVQRRGLVHVRQNVPLLVAVVREAEQGISRSDLLAAIQREAPHLRAVGSARNIISQAQGGFALIGFGDGAFRPTERGLELLSVPDPTQVLQPLLIGRVFGMGHLLLALKTNPDGIGQQALSQQLSTLIPTRKSLWSGAELIQWATATKLARIENGQVLLSDEGQAYADALPVNFLTNWRLDAPIEDDGEAPEQLQDVRDDKSEQIVELQTAAWETLNQRFQEGIESSQLVLPHGFLAELHAALHMSSRKRFVLLAGLSGTGKTSIARAYAEAYCRALGLDDWRDHYAQVAVRPDWTDPAGLLGFVNAVVDPPSFQAAEALHLLLDADQDRQRPYFLCLDEMNLARVEHYFAPFLSAMEGESTTLALHGQLEAIDNVPPSVPWPRNLFIFGTVNMDESTHPFSDKVLDRAFTFEFWEVDLGSWEAKRRSAGANGAVMDTVAPLLKQLHDALAPARRHFGYRTADEFLAYCEAGKAAASPDALLDSAILMKILPRLRGDDSGPLKVSLAKLESIANPGAFPRTHRKIKLMQESLDLTGQARFWS